MARRVISREGMKHADVHHEGYCGRKSDRLGCGNRRDDDASGEENEARIGKKRLTDDPTAC